MSKEHNNKLAISKTVSSVANINSTAELVGTANQIIEDDNIIHKAYGLVSEKYNKYSVSSIVALMEENNINNRIIQLYRYHENKHSSFVHLGLTHTINGNVDVNVRKAYRKQINALKVGMCVRGCMTVSQVNILPTKERRQVINLFESEIKALASWFNCSKVLSHSQVIEVIETIFVDYKSLSIEDVVLCIEMAKKGKLLSMSSDEMYNNFSAPKLLDMFQEYDGLVSKERQKYHLERRKQELNDNTSIDSMEETKRLLKYYSTDKGREELKKKQSKKPVNKEQTLRDKLKDPNYIAFKHQHESKNGSYIENHQEIKKGVSDKLGKEKEQEIIDKVNESAENIMKKFKETPKVHKNE